MKAHPSVLLGLRSQGLEASGLREPLEGWVRACGYQPRFTADADEAVSWLQEEPDAFAASLLDAELGLRASGLRGSGSQELGTQEQVPTWRVVRPWVGRRLVLLVPERRRDLWFEALRSGVGTVLPFPPESAMVRAALEVVTGDRATGHGSTATY